MSYPRQCMMMLTTSSRLGSKAHVTLTEPMQKKGVASSAAWCDFGSVHCEWWSAYGSGLSPHPQSHCKMQVLFIVSMVRWIRNGEWGFSIRCVR